MPAPFPRRRLALLVVVALAACHEVMPSSPIEWPSPPAGYPTTYLRGRITEQGSNIPVGGATVLRDTVQTTTNGEGYYNLTIENGFQIILVVAKPGYDTTRISLALRGGDQVMDLRLTKQ